MCAFHRHSSKKTTTVAYSLAYTLNARRPWHHLPPFNSTDQSLTHVLQHTLPKHPVTNYIIAPITKDARAQPSPPKPAV